MTTTSNVQTLPSASKPQTSKEVIQANVKLLIQQLEAGPSEALTNYLTAVGRFTTTLSATSSRSHSRSPRRRA